MDFEELMTKLSETDGFGEDAVNAVKDRISKPNNEAKNLRARAKKAEAELEKRSKNSVRNALSKHGLDIQNDADVDTEVSNFLETLKTTNENDTDYTKQPAYIKLQKQVMQLEKQSEKEAQEKEAFRIKSDKREIENSLLPDFEKSISNGSTVLNLLIDSTKNPFIINENKVGLKLSDGDIIYGTNAIIDEYKKLYPGQVKNITKSGSESKPGGNSFQVPKQITSIEQVKAMSADQIYKLSPDQNKQMMKVVQEAA